MKDWLKGGLIGASVGVILCIISSPIWINSSSEWIVYFVVLIGFPWSYIIYHCTTFFFQQTSFISVINLTFIRLGYHLNLIGIIINFFIIGSIISLIFHKIK